MALAGDENVQYLGEQIYKHIRYALELTAS